MDIGIDMVMNNRFHHAREPISRLSGNGIQFLMTFARIQEVIFASLLAGTRDGGHGYPRLLGMLQTNFTLRSAPVQMGPQRPDIMKTFWCSKKISIVAWIDGGVDFRPALERCCMSVCPLWDDGFCVHLDRRDPGQ